MERREELINYICKDGNGKDVLINAIDEFLFVENQLQELKQLPFIKINPENPLQQKATPAFKMYKELLQQYTNLLKVLQKATGETGNDEESPLRKWVKTHAAS